MYSLLFHHPVDFDQLRTQAKELLKGCRAGDPDSIRLLAEYHPREVAPDQARLSDAQFTLARAHDYSSWPRMMLGGEMANAIRGNRPDAVLDLIERHPKLLHENVFGEGSNWGPPLSVAAQLDVDEVFRALLSLADQDLDRAFGRAALQGQTEKARALLARGARFAPDEMMGPCESLNVEGMRLLVECGAPFQDETGNPQGPVALLLEGYHRNPTAKHACLAYCEELGIEFPDTPVMAFHRGRIDLLQAHLKRDPELPQRRFGYRDLYPKALGCHDDETLGLHGTPLAGTTLLHMAMDFDEVEIAGWLVKHGADVNARAETEADGFGGHTPLFNLVVSQACVSGRQVDGALGRWLLDQGADPRVRASIRKGMRFIEDETVYEYRDLTALEYGRAFRHRRWVNETVLDLIATR